MVKKILQPNIHLTNKNEANNKASQKIQLTADDVNRGYVNVEFKLPLRFIGEWEGIGDSKDGKNKLRTNISRILNETDLGNFLSQNDFAYIAEINQDELLFVCTLSLAEILLKAKISQINGLEVQDYYDDWYIYGILCAKSFCDIVFSLLKLRENEHYLHIANTKKKILVFHQ